MPTILQGSCALLAAFYLAACGGDDNPSGTTTKKDAGIDRTGAIDGQQQPDSPMVVPDAPMTPDAPTGCLVGGVVYPVGQSVTIPGNCPTTCICLAGGSLGSCNSVCPLPDGGLGPDAPPPVDGPPAIVCSWNGRNYTPGQRLPLNDGCGGSCICLADGTVGNCTGACPVDAPPDIIRRDVPDAPADRPVDRPADLREAGPEAPPIDTACAYNRPCTVTGGGQGICTAGACVACSGASADATCATVYGAGNVCVNGRCVVADCTSSRDCSGGMICNTSSHTCVACNAYTMDAGDPQTAADNRCKADSAYGANTICLNGGCARGDCHNSTNCPAGEICGLSFPNVCAVCTTDAQCRADTTRYGSGHICVENHCVEGTCHDSSECTGTTNGGRLCSTTTHTCVDCASDTQCKNAVGAYGADFICSLSSTNHRCVSSTCSPERSQCAANTADFCCDAACVAGECCVNEDCDTNQVCAGNRCTGCQAMTGSNRNYRVDSVNGDDGKGTGSGRASGGATAPECALKTVGRALELIGALTLSTNNRATITIVGVAGSTTPLATEDPPLTVPAYVTIQTEGGPISLPVPDGSTSAFTFAGGSSSLVPATAAPLTIAPETTGATFGIGVRVATTAITTGAITISNLTINSANTNAIDVVASTAGTVTLSNLVISSPGGSGIAMAAANGTIAVSNTTIDGAGVDGIHVTSGTVQINAGVQATNSDGNGLTVAGGTTTISNGTATNTPTLFNGNDGYGIDVSGAGVLSLTGTISGSTRTVVAQDNGQSNVYYASTGASSITGLYSYHSLNGDGLRIVAGSRITVRSSTFLNNSLNGIHIVTSGVAADDDLTDINLGSSATGTSRGRNTLQASDISTRNDGSGLCVDALAAGAEESQELGAQGNIFAGPTDCGVAATPAPTLTRSADCTGHTDLSIRAQPGTQEVTALVDICQ